jgi:hypothetical protein
MKIPGKRFHRIPAKIMNKRFFLKKAIDPLSARKYSAK